MLRMMTKAEYWAGKDAGLQALTVHDPAHFTIKTMQDVVLLSRLLGVSGKSILEIGGGHSRVLGHLAKANDCTNVDPLEGEHGGPKGQRAEVPYEHVFAEIGASDAVIPSASFDIVFSISVVEHVLAEDLAAFFADIARILKTGGRMIHLIDIYTGLDDDILAEARARFRHYRAVFETGLFRPYDPDQVIGETEIAFHPTYATNPDNIMNEWNHAAPSIIDYRRRAQACSFVMDGFRS